MLFQCELLARKLLGCVSFRFNVQLCSFAIPVIHISSTVREIVVRIVLVLFIRDSDIPPGFLQIFCKILNFSVTLFHMKLECSQVLHQRTWHTGKPKGHQFFQCFKIIYNSPIPASTFFKIMLFAILIYLN